MKRIGAILALGLVVGRAGAESADVGAIDISAAFASATAAASQAVRAGRQMAKEEAATRQAGLKMLTPDQLRLGVHHLRHADMFGADAPAGNIYVLRAIDVVQGHAPEGGGYFANPREHHPPESPVGYPLSLFGTQLLFPTRPTSFCSGASFAAFIEALNLMYDDPALGLPPKSDLTEERLEAMLMQEPDAAHSRREDKVKFWGHWNGSGYGANDALVQYSRMGETISPDDARPGDILTMDWKTRAGHSAVFLGWANFGGRRYMLVWSSQKSANGFGDYLIPWSRVAGVNVVRLTHPENLMNFSIDGSVSDIGLAMRGPHWPSRAAHARRRGHPSTLVTRNDGGGR